MAKTRSQTLKDVKLDTKKAVHSKHRTRKKSTKEPINKLENRQPYKKPNITKKQIEKLLNYIVKEKMNVKTAAKRANFCESTARRYYDVYQKDPKKKIPDPLTPYTTGTKQCTHDQIKRLIGYIVDDKMSLRDAAEKADVSLRSSKRYYMRYLHDPNHGIPVPRRNIGNAAKHCTQEQINTLIDCIIQDKMSLYLASIKASMSINSARIYYNMYIEDPERRIPSPRLSTRSHGLKYPQERIRQLIEYLDNDNMSMQQASVKAGMAENTARKYYQLYLADPKREIPKPTVTARSIPTIEQITDMIGYVRDGNMSVIAASKRVGMTGTTAYMYYHRWRDDPEHKIPVPSRTTKKEKSQKKAIREVKKGKRVTKKEEKKSAKKN